jgi:hypothetical protein
MHKYDKDVLMKTFTAIFTNFYKGLAAYSAILPSFYTSYPYQFDEAALGKDWYNICGDFNNAVKKFDQQNESVK